MALWYDEEFDVGVRFGLRVKETLFMGKSEFQTVSVIDTHALGRALLIDDLWMTAEKDEKTYHEMLVHPVMTTAPSIKRVLIIGGGDGGTAREVLRYPEVEHVDLVEIDGLVVEVSKKYLPTIGASWDDPRLHLTIGDGIAWVKRDDIEPYDVILVDGSDPVGPAEGLFNKSFYEACKAKLTAQGVLSTQSESAHLFKQTHIEMVKTVREVFGNAHPFYQTIMIYSAGAWSWTYASENVSPRDIIDARMEFIESQTEIYNREIHLGAMAIPNHIKRDLK